MRDHALDQWLQDVLKTPTFQRIPVAGDASFRRYYRVHVENNQYIVMDAPPPEAPKVFADIAKLLLEQGLSVPQIIHPHYDEGFLLLSDLGDRLYLNELNEETADTLYQQAFQALLKMQSCTGPLPVFDRAFFNKQMQVFEEWYLQHNKKQTITDEIKSLLSPVYQMLYKNIEEQPKVFVHQDYHSRNLMILETESPGILDFQDALIGPITYDLVSLLQDCYISWPREKVAAWVKDFQRQAIDLKLLEKNVSEKEFLRWFDWTGLQRHIKNLGVFSRLNFRDKKPRYLNDIPRVLNYIDEICQRYQVLNAFGEWLKTLNEVK